MDEMSLNPVYPSRNSLTFRFTSTLLFAEIQHQPHGLPRRHEVIHQLNLMRDNDPPDRLQLQDNGVFNQDVRDKFANDLSIVTDDDGLLIFRAKARFAQFNHQAFLRDRFEKPKSHLVVHAVGTPNDFLRQVFEFRFSRLLQAVIYWILALVRFPSRPSCYPVKKRASPSS